MLSQVGLQKAGKRFGFHRLCRARCACDQVEEVNETKARILVIQFIFKLDSESASYIWKYAKRNTYFPAQYSASSRN